MADGTKPAVRERSVILRPHEVRGIIEGRQSQLRRPVKWRNVATGLNLGFSGLTAQEEPGGWVLYSRGAGTWEERCDPTPCPFGRVGDRLWVRETWGVGSRPDQWGGYDGIEYRADDYGLDEHDDLPCYKVQTPLGVDLCDYRAGWHPSIHMPRWASRITLEIVDVRVQRLGELTDDDAIAEGIGEHADLPDSHWRDYRTGAWTRDPRESFAGLWQSIYGTWDPSLWTWALTFRRVEVR